jgi:hypothetical protein
MGRGEWEGTRAASHNKQLENERKTNNISQQREKTHNKRAAQREKKEGRRGKETQRDPTLTHRRANSAKQKKTCILHQRARRGEEGRRTQVYHGIPKLQLPIVDQQVLILNFPAIWFASVLRRFPVM